MSRLKLEDGAELHVSERGEGPLVVLAPYWSFHPSVFDGLEADLLADHRVARFDDRGTGESSREGPFDMETSAGDLAAALEHAGGDAVVFATADGCNRAVRVAARRPELVTATVTIGGAPVTAASLASSEALVGSRSVIDAFLEMAGTDHRGALRSMVARANPQMAEEGVRERVALQLAYCPAEPVTERLRAWVADAEVERYGREAGDRLWFLSAPGGGGGWFPRSDEYESLVRNTFPAAHFETVEDGIMSRPDEAAAVIRRVAAMATASR